MAMFAQLGAYHSKARAESEWKILAAKYPSELKSLKPHFVPGKSRNGPVYKLRVSVPSATDATGLCATAEEAFPGLRAGDRLTQGASVIGQGPT